MNKITVLPIKVNLSMYAFALAGQDYYQCYTQFTPERFSLVPYALCCQGIELAFKSLHLHKSDRDELRKKYGHKLVASYKDLKEPGLRLSDIEIEILEKADAAYSSSSKDFDYLNIGDAVHGYERFPDLGSLGSLTKKITEYALTITERRLGIGVP